MSKISRVPQSVFKKGLSLALMLVVFFCYSLAATAVSVVNVMDPPYNAVGNGVTDDTSAIQAAIASGAARIYFPTPSSAYVLSGAVSVPAGVILYGDSQRLTKIKCLNSGNNITFFTLTSYAAIENLQIYGDVSNAGTGVSFSNGTYTFSGHGSIKNSTISSFSIGVNVNSWYDLTVNRCYIQYCNIGLNATPPTNGGDNGYINCLYIEDSYFHQNTAYDAYLNPAVRISNVKFINTIFDPGPNAAKVYMYYANPCSFDNCYFEGNSGVPAISSDLSNFSVKNCYFLGTGGISLNNTQQSITIEKCRFTSTDILNAGYALHTVRIIDSCFPDSGNVLPSTSNAYYSNSKLNGVTYCSQVPNLTIGAGNAQGAAYAYTKSITATIPAGTTAYLISNNYIYGIWNGTTVGYASFSDSYNPGLIITVTPANTGSTNYFCVLATNTTGADITISNKTLNVVIRKMTTYTSL